ncbi:ABC transporter permease [Plantactinospora soyae]|uniref:Transport permease protein n=1 Tax=Plantactinospora soyae TaxID=1544732 RepID=A0A927M2N6_9ACTN|nr:ABC transporter permease [Plantactinospora soyae]MBE1485556.1 lipooligosaccharide transport system permease protein [Plantactinospora soyae]
MTVTEPSEIELSPMERQPVLWPALRAVWFRELWLFRRYWPAVTFGSLVEPLVYLAGFGVGIGALVGSVGGHSYPQFLGIGMVLTSMLFSSVFTGMFETFSRRRFQRIYDAMLSQPVDPWELVTAEASWIAAKSCVYSCAPLLVTVAVGLPVGPQLALVPLIQLIAGFGFALAGMWVSCLVPALDWLRLIVSGVLTPLVLAAGVFFPVDQLPGWASPLVALNPVYHCMQLTRNAAFGELGPADLGHVAVVLLGSALAWWLAIRAMNRRLID